MYKLASFVIYQIDKYVCIVLQIYLNYVFFFLTNEIMKRRFLNDYLMP